MLVIGYLTLSDISNSVPTSLLTSAQQSNMQQVSNMTNSSYMFFASAFNVIGSIQILFIAIGVLIFISILIRIALHP